MNKLTGSLQYVTIKLYLIVLYCIVNCIDCIFMDGSTHREGAIDPPLFPTSLLKSLYCTVLYCIIFYHIINSFPPRPVLYCIIYCIVLYHIVLYHIVLYHIILYHIVSYCIVLYCIVLYCIVSYCIVL